MVASKAEFDLVFFFLNRSASLIQSILMRIIYLNETETSFTICNQYQHQFQSIKVGPPLRTGGIDNYVISNRKNIVHHLSSYCLALQPFYCWTDGVRHQPPSHILDLWMASINKKQVCHLKPTGYITYVLFYYCTNLIGVQAKTFISIFFSCFRT